MANPARHRFAHRVNQDGSVDSICRMCFETVATEGNEVHLLAAEEIHNCSGLRAKALHPERPEHMRGLGRPSAETGESLNE
jgi:hypothetical protein